MAIISGLAFRPDPPTTELFDPVTGTWDSVYALEPERWDHTATLLFDGRVMVVGGIRVGSDYEDQAILFLPP